MQKLHPKAVWLFLIQYFLFFLFITFMITISLAPLISNFFVRGQILIPTLFLCLVVLLVSTVLSYVLAKLTYRYWKYEVAENALKIEKGIIWKKYISIPYERIQNVDIYRGVLTRILGLSDLQIQTAGYSGYHRRGFASEGKLPGLDVKRAEQLRDELIGKVKGTSQGL